MSSEILSLNNEDKVLIQITDTHLMDHPETGFVGINPEENFLAVVQDIQQRFDHIDAIINTGDIAQAAVPATYTRYLNTMKQMNVDFYHIPGNHDNLDIFPFHDPQPYPSIIELGQWRVILLNSTVNGRTDGRIQTVQLELLKDVLQRLQNYYVIITCHHNPFNMDSRWLDQHKLKNADELKAVLELDGNLDLFKTTITCYNPDNQGRSCGTCPSCSERLAAFKKIGFTDPIEYQYQ